MLWHSNCVSKSTCFEVDLIFGSEKVNSGTAEEIFLGTEKTNQQIISGKGLKSNVNEKKYIGLR